MSSLFKNLIYQFLFNLQDFENLNSVSDFITNFILNELNDVELLYKNLIYMNNITTIGIFSIYYKKKLEYFVLNNDLTNIKNLLSTCKSPEIDDNEYLSSIERNELFQLLENEKLALNHFIKTNVDLKKEFNKKNFYDCFYEVCNCINKTNVITPTYLPTVWIPDYFDNFKLSILRSYNLPNLLYDIINDNNNEYTNHKFSQQTKNFVINRYKTEYKIILKYCDLFKVHS